MQLKVDMFMINSRYVADVMLVLDLLEAGADVVECWEACNTNTPCLKKNCASVIF